MAPVTALATLVLAAATVLEARRPSLFRTAALALLALAPSAATVGTFLSDLPAWSDSLLTLDLERFGGTQTGRMSPLAALGLVLAGLALVLLGLARRWPACGAAGVGLALLTTLLGVTVALGYLHGAQLLREGPFVSMAFSAGLAQAGLGAALVGIARATGFRSAW